MTKATSPASIGVIERVRVLRGLLTEYDSACYVLRHAFGEAPVESAATALRTTLANGADSIAAFLTQLESSKEYTEARKRSQ